MDLLPKVWNSVKYYAQTSYYMAFVYGKIRSLVQPYLATELNVSHIQEGVYIGDIGSAYNHADELKELGITHIVTVILGVAPRHPKDFVYLTIPVRDVESENIEMYLEQTTAFINDAVEAGGKVLVHCVCGVSRSATIVAAWVMIRNGGHSVEETIEMLKQRRSCVQPNPAFINQLESYAATQNGNSSKKN